MQTIVCWITRHATGAICFGSGRDLRRMLAEGLLTETDDDDEATSVSNLMESVLLCGVKRR